MREEPDWKAVLLIVALSHLSHDIGYWQGWREGRDHQAAEAVSAENPVDCAAKANNRREGQDAA
ncbi:MAG: hypothetical protein AAF663_08455 [Planctomycetota bacterium]